MSKINKLKFNNFKGLAILALCACLGATVFTSCDKSEQAPGETQLYTCGMHPQVIQEEPGICPICNMNLTPMKTETQTSAHAHNADSNEKNTSKDKKILHWRAPMDPTYISEQPGKSPMGMDLIPVYEGDAPGAGTTITIDPATIQNSGIRSAEVKRQSFSRTIRSVGHVDYDEETLYNVNIKFSGWLEELFVERTGDLVKKGQPLFKIYSPELVTTQEEYLLAFKNNKKLSGGNISEAVDGAARLLNATRQRLQFWDISDFDIRALEESGEFKKTLTIHSPASGVVLHKQAVEGSFIKAGMNLYRIADLSTIWVYAHIFEYELPWIKTGQTVKMELPYIPGKSFDGRIDYIYPYLDAKSRDIKVRLVFDNKDLLLKPQMYANVTIKSKIGDNVVVIPGEAIVRSGQRNLVFLDLGNGKFAPQQVTLGAEGEDGFVQILAGLQEGQQIVLSAHFLLDSESRLREVIQKMIQKKVDANKKATTEKTAIKSHEQ